MENYKVTIKEGISKKTEKPYKAVFAEFFDENKNVIVSGFVSGLKPIEINYVEKLLTAQAHKEFAEKE